MSGSFYLGKSRLWNCRVRAWLKRLQWGIEGKTWEDISTQNGLKLYNEGENRYGGSETCFRKWKWENVFVLTWGLSIDEVYIHGEHCFGDILGLKSGKQWKPMWSFPFFKKKYRNLEVIVTKQIMESCHLRINTS